MFIFLFEKLSMMYLRVSVSMQNLIFDMCDAENMLVASVILLSAMIYWICLIPSTEFITMAWSIFGKAELAVVSAKFLTWKLLFGEFSEIWETFILLIAGFSYVEKVLELLICLDCLLEANNLLSKDDLVDFYEFKRDMFEEVFSIAKKPRYYMYFKII